MSTGYTVWFTGLSGAGKTTLSANVAAAIRDRGQRVEVLDGDVVRTNLSKGLGFSREDRDTNIRKIEIDHDHGGLIKVNPLADWTEEEVWEYVRANGVPSNTLYDQGYKTIGCDPCTRPVEPGAEQRSGRWWWEKGAPKECGMHCAVETGGFEHELEVIVGHRG